MKKTLFSVAFLATLAAFAQTKLEAVVRPRLEYRDGFQSPSQDGDPGGTFVQQRTRLTFTSEIKGIEIKVAPQDIRVWGQVRSLNVSDDQWSLHEGWVKFDLDSAGLWSLKLGRQELNYDDARILGNVDWAQQARSHDAALLCYKTDKLKLDFAAVYNQNGPNNTTNFYTLANQTKSMQMLHLNTNFGKLNSSFLVMNNMFQDASPVPGNALFAMQTFGTYNKFGSKESALIVDFAAYVQTGKTPVNAEIYAFLASANAMYKVKNVTKLGLGAEYISGTDQNTTDGVNRSFNPIYGTNHKFNGLMDYYFVGNHGGDVGLLDIYLKGIQKINKKLMVVVAFHQFNAAAKVVDAAGEDMSGDLGQELDIVFKYKHNDNIGIAAGYSQYFSTTSLSDVKNLANTTPLNQWAWVMVTGKLSKLWE